jgi:hypothetical protein
MQVMPVDLVALTAIILGCMMFLIPIAGLTARFAIRPITEAIVKMNASGADREVIQLLERRVALLEQELHSMGDVRRELESALESVEFQRQLSQPRK